MNIFISGATGYIGKHILKKLSTENYNILATSRKKHKETYVQKKVDWVFGDLNDLDFLKTKLIEFNPDITIHLAWNGIPDYSEAISKNNLDNSISLLNLIISNTNCKKILVSGSCWEYGKNHGICKENDPVNINSYFNWAKYSLYRYLSIKCAENNIDYNWFRIFYVYGLGQRDSALIPTLIKSINKNKLPLIHNPLNKNDFIFIDDVVKVFSKAIKKNLPSGVYNLGSGSSSSVYDISLIVEQELSSSKRISSKIIENGSSDEAINFWADMETTLNKLNISELTSLNSGIKKLIRTTVQGN
jgi:nucleoside-diphosphate-sugar epimerase